MQVYAFFQLTQPAHGGQPASANALQPRRSRPRRHGTQPVTAAADVPPHAFVKGGELSGVIWTVPLSRFGPEDTVTEWPPATAGPGAYARKWRAALSQGTLVLTPILDPHPKVAADKAAHTAAAMEGSASNGGSGEGAAEAAEAPGVAEAAAGSGEPAPAPLLPAAPAKVGIPLDGCSGALAAGRVAAHRSRARVTLGRRQGLLSKSSEQALRCRGARPASAAALPLSLPLPPLQWRW